MTPTLHYTLAMPRPETHRFHVSLEVQGWQADEALLVLPAWTPGSYLIREFARHVEAFQAETLTGEPLRWQRRSKGTWRVETADTIGFRVRYEVYANELTVRTSHLDSSHGYFNGTNLFMYLDELKASPLTLSIQAPPSWRVSIALPEDGPGQYRAESYDILADSPGEIGTHRLLSFEALGKPHEVALWGQGNEDEAALVADLKHIVESVATLFGSTLPYERYLFIVHLGDRVNGGLEHRASTTLAVDRWTFKPRGEYEKFLRLAAHEFFHTWLVKRIRPHNLGPFDYTQEVYTPLLWVMEGFTTYYDVMLLRRAGLISLARCLELLAERISTYRQQPGRLVQSLEESSLTTWIKFYRQDENYINTGISYYLKGSLVALLLDLDLRLHTQNAHSLDTLLQALWEVFGQPDVGFTPEQFMQQVETLGSSDIAHNLARFVQGLDELPLETMLARAGLHLTSERRPDELGVWLGLRYRGEPNGLLVQNVLRDSPAEDAGLMPNDRLIAVDGFAIRDEAFLTARLQEKVPGDFLRLHLFRHGALLECMLTLQEAPPARYNLSVSAAPSSLQRKVLASWLVADTPQG